MNSDEYVKEASISRSVQVMESIEAELMRSINRSLHTCVTCSFFEQKRELCQHVTALEKKQGGLRPPARVIAFGCGQWDPKVPF